MRRWLMGLLFLLALWQIGEGGYIQAKAWLAQILLERAWQQTLQGQSQVKPWPWADTWPVAKLELPRIGASYIVLEGTNGPTLAFGPGWDSASSLVGTSGVSLIAAHRDTHFRGLRHLQAGDPVKVQGADGGWHSFRVQDTRIADARRMAIRRSDQAETEARLVLVTCYPFDDWVPGGPLRYVVTTELEKGPVPAAQLAASTH